ncbi:response regulator [Clostridium sp. FP1]|uniref:response regulator n=1 Tax=Clostridium sp. FP1 TaxID=2724076 RepID=UPI0013E95401|nr:response regulator transcription factor [Clostridium sp. FP1]MBZ9634797.1 response regulator transcription factor [Clostridium sp. FP1]
MESKAILIADDEPLIRKLVKDFLKMEGFNIFEAQDGKEALDIFKENKDKIDLVILDVMMPVYDGWSVCREIKKISDIPIVMLTARGEEVDEVFGFDLGADEYITKPFSPIILVSRIKAILRRIQGSKSEEIHFDKIEIDEKAHMVTIDNKIVTLSPKEYELLLYFIENKGIALSRDKILNTVWNYNYLGDLRTVDSHIKRLRSKLGEQGDLIQTVRGLGYRFEVDK